MRCEVRHANDGLAPTERRTQLSLWALGSSPLILGVDLTGLDPTDLGYPHDTDVLAADQDSIAAKRVVDTSGTSQVVSVSAGKAGLPSCGYYRITDLWTDQRALIRALKGSDHVHFFAGACKLQSRPPGSRTVISWAP